MTMLSGIRIVDLTTVIFGPYATQMLADLGAEVIKVETPGLGDISRYLGSGVPDPTMGSIHLTVNRGKRSIALDLKKPEDAAVLRDLVAGADVFFHNVRGKAIAKLGFDYASCQVIKHDIIYVHGTGFGQDGPYADLQAYDDVIQAATGTTSLLPRVDGDPRPRYFPSLIADKIAGQFGAQAILAALIHKLRTGEGQAVEVPMFECFASFMLTEHLRDAALDPPLGPAGYPRQLDPTRQPFPPANPFHVRDFQPEPRNVERARVTRGKFDRCGIAEKSKIAGAAGNQPLGRHPPAEPVVGADHAMPLAFRMIAPHHHREIAIGNVLDPIELIGLPDHVHAIDHP